VLTQGGFAECYEFISQETGKHYAAKVIGKETLNKGKAKEKLESEILIHKGLRHRHIVKFEHFFEDHDYVYILLELCSNNVSLTLARPSTNW
jgi:polo-like kinase 1